MIPSATYLEPIVGWRFWRVQRIVTLDQGVRFRLCAAGAYGKPKVWQPQVANVAVCSNRAMHHDAPHRDHECGIYAYRDRSDAEEKLVHFEATDRFWVENGKRQPTPTWDTWAIGRVSLWGRVIECELGWRAQFAYPYDISVFTNGTGGAVIGADYAIDTTSVPRRELRSLIDAHPETVESARADAEDDSWYQTSIYGIMDSSFLKPYHEKVMARLGKIERDLQAVVAIRKTGANDA